MLGPRPHFSALFALTLVVCACSGGGSGRNSGGPSSVTGAASATSAPINSPTPTGTPGAASTPPRGVLVVLAMEPQGILGQIAGGPVVGGAPHMPAQYRVTTPDEVQVQTFASGLEIPWALAFAPDGRLFVSERPGRIRVVQNGVVNPTPWATPAVQPIGEGGLLGLALDPDFTTSPWVYVCYTFDAGGTPENRVSRFLEVNGAGANEQVLLEGAPAAAFHDGCRLKFGPDGALYATSGDATQPSHGQNLASLAGKIFRLNRDGTIPADNPFPGSPVYSYGHRNPQGLAFDPQTGALFETEHGPSGEFSLHAYDEVNIIVPGGNYGWAAAVGAPGLPQFHDPLLTYLDHAVPPAGATFYTATRIPQWTGNFLFTSLGGQHLQRVVLDASHQQVVAIERLFELDFSSGIYGRLRDVIEGPDGALYMCTSNRDGRGAPAADDDRILRIVPAAG